MKEVLDVETVGILNIITYQWLYSALSFQSHVHCHDTAQQNKIKKLKKKFTKRSWYNEKKIKAKKTGKWELRDNVNNKRDRERRNES
jgi:hypothetical protein